MRVRGWESLLDEHIRHAGEFAWGSNDCALWCAAWVRAATGRDLASEWRGRYKSERGLRALLERRGYADAAAIADARLEAVPVPLARRGDVLLHPQGCLGLCNGIHGLFLTDRGCIMHPTLDCRRAWRV